MHPDAAAMPPALFTRDAAHEDVLHATELVRGPWDHGFLHGGAVCGALGWAIERAQPDGDLLLARMTTEIRTMVPAGPLRVEAHVTKPGNRTRVTDATLLVGDRVAARATSLWVARRANGASAGDRRPVAPRPPTAADPAASSGDVAYPRPGFNCDAVELRLIKGTTEDRGPGLIWVRLRCPVVDGEPTSHLLALLTLADLGVAVGWDHSLFGTTTINPDVTVQVNREPVGEWLLFASRSHHALNAVGFCETVLSDDAGLFGRVLQTLVEAPDGLAIGGAPVAR